MDEVDKDNARLLKKGVNLLLKRACNALAANASESDPPSDNAYKIFGNSAPVKTFEGTADLMEVLSKISLINVSPGGDTPLSEDELTLMEDLAAHVRKRNLERDQLKHIPAPELT